MSGLPIGADRKKTLSHDGTSPAVNVGRRVYKPAAFGKRDDRFDIWCGHNCSKSKITESDVTPNRK